MRLLGEYLFLKNHKKGNEKFFITSLFVVLLLFTASGCLNGLNSSGGSQTLRRLEVLSQPPGIDAHVDVNFCTTPRQLVQSQLKYIFVIDKSGSNVNNYQMDSAGNPICPINSSTNFATDPTGQNRYSSLLNFVQNSAVDPNRWYAMVEFSTDIVSILPRGIPGSPSATPMFYSDGNPTDRASFVTQLQNRIQLPGGPAPSGPQDTGATDYLDALAAVRDLIDQDIQRANFLENNLTPSSSRRLESSAYIIVFVSDGFPIVPDPAPPFSGQSILCQGTTPIVNAQPVNNILNSVRVIMGLEATPRYVDSIALFSAYYYHPSNFGSNAAQLLQQMAQTGNGIFLQFGGAPVDFTRFTIPQRYVNFDVAEIFVNNKSWTWWGPNREVDRDTDGLPDLVETAALAGSNPNNRDSNNNGLNDLVEYRLNEFTGMQNPRAVGVSTAPCAGLPTPYADTDADGLNDCEERVIGTMGFFPDNFDSNSDMIPDELQLRSGASISSGSSGVDPDFDLLSTLFEVKAGLPPLIPNNFFLTLSPQIYTSTLDYADPVQKCYTYRIEELAQLQPNETVQVNLIEKTTAILNRTRIRRASGTFNGSARTLTITVP